jgi:hypothetical protein
LVGGAEAPCALKRTLRGCLSVESHLRAVTGFCFPLADARGLLCVEFSRTFIALGGPEGHAGLHDGRGLTRGRSER